MLYVDYTKAYSSIIPDRPMEPAPHAPVWYQRGSGDERRFHTLIPAPEEMRIAERGTPNVRTRAIGLSGLGAAEENQKMAPESWKKQLYDSFNYLSRQVTQIQSEWNVLAQVAASGGFVPKAQHDQYLDGMNNVRDLLIEVRDSAARIGYSELASAADDAQQQALQARMSIQSFLPFEYRHPYLSAVPFGIGVAVGRAESFAKQARTTLGPLVSSSYAAGQQTGASKPFFDWQSLWSGLPDWMKYGGLAAAAWLLYRGVR